MEVSLVAVIGSDGTVRQVRMVQPYSGLAGHLAQICAASLKGWQFRPAVSGDKLVEADYTVHFRFGEPGSR